MKKLLLLCLVIAAAIVVWKFGGRASGDDPLSDLQHRLEAAEKSYQQAGRAAGLAGVDNTADAGAAHVEVERVVMALRELSRKASSNEVRLRIDRLLHQAEALKRKMG